MPKRKRPAACKLCGKQGTSRRRISYNGKCGPCAEAAVARGAREMAAKSGPAWDRYIAAMARIVEGAQGPGVVPASDDRDDVLAS